MSVHYLSCKKLSLDCISNIVNNNVDSKKIHNILELLPISFVDIDRKYIVKSDLKEINKMMLISYMSDRNFTSIEKQAGIECLHHMFDYIVDNQK